MSFIVAIDGPAGSGKGTIAKIISNKLGFLNIDTGAMFRCIALECLRKNISLDETEKVEEVLKNSNIELKVVNENMKVFLNNEDVSLAIRTEEVSKFASSVSTIKIVRDKLLDMQRKIALNQDVVMEGRDIGSVVFPNADVKIFLVATAEERAKRRVKQNEEKGIKSNYDEVLEEIKIRDERDSTREIAPLKQADDAILVDSTNMSIDEVARTIIKLIEEKRK